MAIEVLLWPHDARTVGVSTRAAIDNFCAQRRIEVRLENFTPEREWEEVIKIALHRYGPDVTEVGSSWVSSLAAMNALRPFGLAETALFGGKTAFWSPVWESASLPGDHRVWAIPRTTDTRLVFYRRDLLERAGVDEQTAFQTPEQFERTLQRLQAAGIEAPLAIETGRRVVGVHVAACWVWGAGGDFVSADGKQILFDRPEARAGLRTYFSLHRYISPRIADWPSPEVAFCRGQAAVTISGLWCFWTLRDTNAGPEVVTNLGAASPPGVPYVGGTHLVVWGHSPIRNQQLAVEIVHLLSGRELQSSLSEGTFPARLDARHPLEKSHPLAYRAVVNNLKTGRFFPNTSLWSAVEDRLTVAFGSIWSELLGKPDVDVDTVIARHLDPLAERLNMTLHG